VLVLDSRVARKRYGRVFLDSLPPARQVVGQQAVVFEAMRRFFRDTNDSNDSKDGKTRKTPD
jgi:ATP-dependent DNA helicase DinG